jgi:hypothetical protein
MTAAASLSSLLKSNVRILSQKLELMDALVSRLGYERALHQYKAICPIVGASIGQHIRHSMDHVELAVKAGSNLPHENSAPEIHYDLRIRGGVDEHDMEAAKVRIQNLMRVLEKLQDSDDVNGNKVGHRNVSAQFMLSGQDGVEYALPSTVARELGFVAHHAIHHLAMAKVIVQVSAGLQNNDLPFDFGRAPSTVHFDLTKS